LSKIDPKSRVACKTVVSCNLVANVGEVTCDSWDGIETKVTAREVIMDIGYDNEKLKFWHESFGYINRIPDISQGVTEGEGLHREQDAGDQAMMFGYATNDPPNLIPAPTAYSHFLLLELEKLRKEGKVFYLRPDSKSQVSVRYKEGRLYSITAVVISQQTDDRALEDIRRDLVTGAKRILEPTGLLTEESEYYINPTGAFVLGRPYADAGLTGRKIVADTYGGVGSHGGGAFSGKNPSKVG
jgi:S-adenosylmethionine synthetase